MTVSLLTEMTAARPPVLPVMVRVCVSPDCLVMRAAQWCGVGVAVHSEAARHSRCYLVRLQDVSGWLLQPWRLGPAKYCQGRSGNLLTHVGCWVNVNIIGPRTGCLGVSAISDVL